MNPSGFNPASDNQTTVDQIATAVVSRLVQNYPDVFRKQSGADDEIVCCPDDYVSGCAADKQCCPDDYDYLNKNSNRDNECDTCRDSEDIAPDADVQPDEYDDQASAEDSNFQGDIREIPGARLVYKRKNETGTYDEMWVYVMSKSMRDENNIKQSILSGTDVEPNSQQSPDGKQSYSMWTIGNRQMIKVSGLPT